MMYHIGLTKSNIEGAKYAILPGDPGRVVDIAKKLDDYKKLNVNREYTSYLGSIAGEKVLVISTGMGGPSTAICVEELNMIGIEYLIRVGTSGGMQLDVEAGDIVVAQGAIRQEGTSKEYLPIEFPAIADLEVTNALVESCKDLGLKYHAGVVQCKDSFYGQHSPDRMPVGYELLNKWDAWIKGGALCSEMETSALFTVSSVLRLHAGAVLLVIWNQSHSSEYIFTRVNINARGRRDVVLCGTDTLRPYWRYVLDGEGNITSDTEQVFKRTTRYGYYGTSFGSNTYPQVNNTRGGSYLGYTAPLYSCDYKIYMRSVDDRPTHVNPDTLSVEYDKYLADANWPCGGVIRNYQKLYLSQPGDNQISYVDDYANSDFLINYSYSNYFQPLQRQYACMVPFDPTVFEEGEFETASASRLEELLGATNNFKHLGINAGYGVDDPNCEFPLIWCQTPNQAVMTPEARTEGKLYYSGVTGICPNNENTYLANGRPNRIRKDVFRCFYQGDACLFVTSGVFNISNTANPSVGSIQPHGSIYLDYIHFEPVIEEDDEE